MKKVIVKDKNGVQIDILQGLPDPSIWINDRESKQVWGKAGEYSIETIDITAQLKAEADAIAAKDTQIQEYRHSLKNIAQTLESDLTIDEVKSALTKLIKLLVLNDGLK